MRKLREAKKPNNTPDVVEEKRLDNELKSQVFEFDTKLATEQVLNLIDSRNRMNYSDHYMDPKADLYPTISATPDGEKMVPSMHNLSSMKNEMDQTRYNQAALYSLDNTSYGMTTVPTPFITIAQRVDSTFECVDFIQQTHNEAFQFHYADYLKTSMNRNANMYLLSQLRHVILAALSSISDEYKRATCTLYTPDRFTLGVDDIVYRVKYKIDEIINTDNIASFDALKENATAFDYIVTTTLVPELVATVFDYVDAASIRDIYNHCIADSSMAESIAEVNHENDPEGASAYVRHYEDNRVNFSARDLHAIFTAACFDHYKRLQRDLEIVINLYRIQLNNVYANIAHDEVVNSMYETGVKRIMEENPDSPRNYRFKNRGKNNFVEFGSDCRFSEYDNYY